MLRDHLKKEGRLHKADLVKLIKVATGVLSKLKRKRG